MTVHTLNMQRRSVNVLHPFQSRFTPSNDNGILCPVSPARRRSSELALK